MEYPGVGSRVQKRFLLEGESTAAWPLLVVADAANDRTDSALPKLASPAGFEPA